MQKKLTVVILTKNEENNIVDCIANAKQVTDDVLIIDSGSTDATVELAKQAGARVVHRAWDDDFSAQRNFAIENSDAEWLLYLDADERMSEELVQDVRDAVAADKNECYEIKRINWAFGHRFLHGVFGPDSVVRMFKRVRFKYVNKVHEHPECVDKLAKLTGYLEHHTRQSMEQHNKKMEQYSSIWAEEQYAEGKRCSALSVWIHTVGGFMKMYFLKFGFLDGCMGLKVSFQYAKYVMKKYVKLKELEAK